VFAEKDPHCARIIRAVAFPKAVMLDFVQHSPLEGGLSVFQIQQDFRRATILHNARVSNP
jgi:hypothetical protein